MQCKKCRQDTPGEGLYCMWCGAPLRRNPKKKLYQRPDGLYEKIMMLKGKRIPFRGKTEQEVYQKMAAYKEQEAVGPSFLSVSEAWEEERFPDLAYNTAKSYTAPLQRARTRFGAAPIREVTQREIAAYITHYAHQGCSYKTVKNQLLVLHLIFNYTVSSGDISDNPADHMDIPKNLAKGKRSLPADEQLSLIKSNWQGTFGLLANFLLYTSCRVGEALALTYGDIDRGQKMIHITKSVYHQNNIPKTKSPKTEAGYRDVPLLDVLEGYLPSGSPDQLLFPGTDGGLMTNSALRRGRNLYCKALGLYRNTYVTDSKDRKHAKIVPLITPHQLRHGYATILFEAGVEDKDVYTHISQKRKDETVRCINEYLDKSGVS